MKHKILIYGGLGDVALKRIIPAMTLLKKEFSIEFGMVDLKDEGMGEYYKYEREPLDRYNAAIIPDYARSFVFVSFFAVIWIPHALSGIIATPNDSHAKIAVKVLNAGLHVLCKKPLAHTLEAADVKFSKS